MKHTILNKCFVYIFASVLLATSCKLVDREDNQSPEVSSVVVSNKDQAQVPENQIASFSKNLSNSVDVEVYGQSDFYLKILLNQKIVFWYGSELNPTKDRNDFLMFKTSISNLELLSVLDREIQQDQEFLWQYLKESKKNKMDSGEVEQNERNCLQLMLNSQKDYFKEQIEDNLSLEKWKTIGSDVTRQQPRKIFSSWHEEIEKRIQDELDDENRKICQSVFSVLEKLKMYEGESWTLKDYYFISVYQMLFRRINEISHTSLPIQISLYQR